MEEYIVQGHRFTGKTRPELILGVDKTIRFQFTDEDGEPIVLNPADVFTVAVDSNFQHSDTLMVYGRDITVVNADSGIIDAVIPCNTTAFEKKLDGRDRLTVWIEITRIEAGIANEEIILRDKCSALNSVQFGESEPEPSDPAYYTAAQVDALFASRSISLAACSGLGEYLSDNAFTMTWIDPDDVILNGSVLAQWNKTVLVRKVGSYPANHTDGTILATTSKSLGNKNAYRSTGFTDSERESGTTYYYKLFSQTTGGNWNNLTGNQFAESTSMSWGMVQGFVRAGRGPDLFPVGTVFEVDHQEYNSNGHGIYFRVAGHDQVTPADESLPHTMCLEMVEILFRDTYDGSEALYALTQDTTAQAGKEYYTYNGSSYTKLIDGTDYDVGDPIPVAEWYEKNIDNRSVNGSNNAEQSNLIQWANSTGAANQWFTPQTIWDLCSSTLAGKSGFMRYLDPLFSAVVQPAKLTTARCTADGGGGIIHNAKFWPLSMAQVYGIKTGDVMENGHLSYYSAGNSPVKQLNGENSYWWLRSPSIGNPYDVRFILNNGGYTTTKAIDSFGFSFACIIA